MNYVKCEMHEATHIKIGNEFFNASAKDHNGQINIGMGDASLWIGEGSPWKDNVQFYKEEKARPYIYTALVTENVLAQSWMPDRFNNNLVKVTIEVVE